MKKIWCVMALLILLMACNEQETSIEVNKTNERLELLAKYPQNKQAKFEPILQGIFMGKNSGLLAKDLSVGKEIKLTNGAIFYVRYHPGKLELEMLLEKNDVNGRKYFDTLSRQIKKTLE